VGHDEMYEMMIEDEEEADLPHTESARIDGKDRGSFDRCFE
jgi:hypothetical protein